MKKINRRLLLLCLCFLVVLGVNLNFKAAAFAATETSIPIGNIQVDYKEHQIVIKDTANQMYFLGAANKNGIVKEYEMFESWGEETCIDLSGFSVKQEWTLYLHGNKDTKDQKIIINAALSKLKAECDFTYLDPALNKSIYDTFQNVQGTAFPEVSNVIKVSAVKSNGEQIFISSADLMFRTELGDWMQLNNENWILMINYLERGATLYCREENFMWDSESDLTYGRSAVNSITGATKGRPYSPAVKIKIPKRGKAPKIKVNYSTGVVSIKNHSAYFSHSMPLDFSDWLKWGWVERYKEEITKDVPSYLSVENYDLNKYFLQTCEHFTQGLNFYESYEEYDENAIYYLNAYNKATAKKAMSNITSMEIPVPKKTPEAVAKSIEIISTLNNKKSKQLKLKNGGSETIEYSIVEVTTSAAVGRCHEVTPHEITIVFAEAEKWRKLKPGGSVKLKKEESDGKYILFRLPVKTDKANRTKIFATYPEITKRIVWQQEAEMN